MDPTSNPPNPPRPALAPMAAASNASPGAPQPAVAMSSKLPISGLLSGPPGLGKENAPAAPAPRKSLQEIMMAADAHLEAFNKAEKEKKAASRKRKAADPPVDEASVDLDAFNVEDLPMTENCDQVRRKINRMLDAGGMTKTAFADIIGVSMKSLSNFLAMHGPYKGANSSSYDNSWAYFKKRELAGLKLPVKKPAKMAKANDVAVATPEPTTASTAASTKAPGGSKKATGTSAGVDISGVHLDGEENDLVPLYDSCDEVRRKINAHLKKDGVTQAQFCRDILAQLQSAKRPSNIQSSQLARFRGMKGAMAGGSSNVFYGAYVFFEKIRVAEGKPKSQHRLDMEAFWSDQGGVSRESDRGGYYCLEGERPTMDSIGRVTYHRG